MPQYIIKSDYLCCCFVLKVDVKIRKEIEKCCFEFASNTPNDDIEISPESEEENDEVSLLGQKRQQKLRALKQTRFTLRYHIIMYV